MCVTISLCFSEGVHSWLGPRGARSSNHCHLVLRTRPDLVAKMSDREVVTAWLMICAQSPRNQDGTAKPPAEEPIRAGLADSLEGYQQVSIGERLRALDGEPVDTSRWLEAVELAGETDGAPVKVVNRLTPEELDELVSAGAERPLGCLPMRLEEYAKLLRWLAGNQSNANANVAAGSADSSAASAEAAGGSVAIRRRLSLDPTAFADLVGNFGKRFSTAVGCPESLEREALRLGRRRLRASGGPALARRHPKPPTAAVAG